MSEGREEGLSPTEAVSRLRIASLLIMASFSEITECTDRNRKQRVRNGKSCFALLLHSTGQYGSLTRLPRT